ncbi:hypothetical protein MST27_02805 [Pseudomonas sp. PS1]|uniref:Uncharacterized protein n=1 Tax=Stutzerimonas marianensis TaxID=2929513 RepID=A0A9X1W2P0_9GAMM|nr:hypothetical protein [Pseudomonas marianensis]MCJ0972299.1 hypothetical protein [Pseudomonas marianensis]
MIEFDLPARTYHENGAQIATAFREVCDWLKSLGVFSASNRFSTYLKIFDNFESEAPYALQSDENFRNYVVVQGEVTELIRIRKWLDSLDSEDYLNQLKKVTSGKPFASQANADPARDFTFELSIAARFLAAGYPVDVTGMADTIAHVGPYKIYVECKRIQSPSKVLKRIKEAQKQIGVRLSADASSKSRGLVACKISEVLNPALTTPIYSNASRFRHESEKSLKAYIRENEENLKKHTAKKQLGILFENNINGVVYDESSLNPEPKIINCRGATLYCHKLGSEDTNLVHNMAPKLASQGVL